MKHKTTQGETQLFSSLQSVKNNNPVHKLRGKWGQGRVRKEKVYAVQLSVSFEALCHVHAGLPTAMTPGSTPQFMVWTMTLHFQAL